MPHVRTDGNTNPVADGHAWSRDDNTRREGTRQSGKQQHEEHGDEDVLDGLPDD